MNLTRRPDCKAKDCPPEMLSPGMGAGNGPPPAIVEITYCCAAAMAVQSRNPKTNGQTS
jgi:hypothetical protein